METKNRRPASGGRLVLPTGEFLLPALASHIRGFVSNLDGTLASPPPGCRVRLRTAPDAETHFKSIREESQVTRTANLCLFAGAFLLTVVNLSPNSLAKADHILPISAPVIMPPAKLQNRRRDWRLNVSAISGALLATVPEAWCGGTWKDGAPKNEPLQKSQCLSVQSIPEGPLRQMFFCRPVARRDGY